MFPLTDTAAEHIRDDTIGPRVHFVSRPLSFQKKHPNPPHGLLAPPLPPALSCHLRKPSPLHLMKKFKKVMGVFFCKCLEIFSLCTYLVSRPERQLQTLGQQKRLREQQIRYSYCMRTRFAFDAQSICLAS